jgi:hypothetical protein
VKRPVRSGIPFITPSFDFVVHCPTPSPSRKSGVTAQPPKKLIVDPPSFNFGATSWLILRRQRFGGRVVERENHDD